MTSSMRRSVTRYKYYGCREYGDFYAKAMYRYGKDGIAANGSQT